MKSHTSFRLVPTSMTLKCAIALMLRFYSPNSTDFQADYVTVVQRRIQGAGFVGFGRTPLRPGVVVKNARTAWLYQSSSVREIFTEIVPQLYTT